MRQGDLINQVVIVQKSSNKTKNAAFFCFSNRIKMKRVKECMSDYVNNYNYVGDTKISVSIKTTNANKCTLSEIFLTEISKSISAF